MATAQSNIAFIQTTDGEFRTWVAAVIAMLNTVGLTQTADTGQIDTGTVAKPAATNTAQGYVIYRFNDAAHSTAPVFFKMEFGAGSATTTPAIWTTIGSSSDGAGTITGTIYRARLGVGMAAGNSTTFPCHANYNATLGVFWMNLLNAQASTGPVVFFVMRGCDPDTGAVGTKVLLHNTSAAAASPRISDVTTQTVETAYLSHTPFSFASSEFVQMHNGRLIAIPMNGSVESGYAVAFPGIFGVHQTHVPAYMTCYVTPFSTEYTYIALTANGSAYGMDQGTQTYIKALWLWE